MDRIAGDQRLNEGSVQVANPDSKRFRMTIQALFKE